jgi:hypothetical protein
MSSQWIHHSSQCQTDPDRLILRRGLGSKYFATARLTFPLVLSKEKRGESATWREPAWDLPLSQTSDQSLTMMNFRGIKVQIQASSTLTFNNHQHRRFRLCYKIMSHIKLFSQNYMHAIAGYDLQPVNRARSASATTGSRGPTRIRRLTELRCAPSLVPHGQSHCNSRRQGQNPHPTLLSR